ncbi:MAG: bifunctional tetrahydrofolate synthase/dihydrofolate synthase [Gammaproteobacteria bacterium]|nr:bifunctional tetrahydrofolate synthase/dihydrofolate synthase [Gammaproteobacteria bacterium]
MMSLKSKRNFADWLTWLEQQYPKEIDLSLERIAQVAKQLQLTTFPFPVITVAGTNGKGSSVAMLAAIYQAAGYRVATTTSPHLLRFTERMCINGQELSEDRWCEAFSNVVDACHEIKPTYFEYAILASLWLMQQAYQQQGLDVIILEVGLGGRFDAVNVVEPDIAVVTSIAIDHVRFLGDNRESIGREKAGIFRANKPAVCGEPDVPDTIYDMANQLSAPLFCQGKDFSYTIQEDSWSWQNNHGKITTLPLPQLPIQNASTVLQTIDLLQQRLPVKRAAIKEGLALAHVPGRFQIVEGDGDVQTVLDVAHNPHSAEYLQQKLVTYGQPVKRLFAVVAMLQDKDILGTLSALQHSFHTWYAAGLPQQRRGASEQTIKQTLEQLSVANIQSFATVAQAYQQAQAVAQPGDAIIVFGSFYTVAEILRLLGMT